MRNLADIKNELFAKQFVNEVRAGRSGSTLAKLAKGMEDIPVNRMMRKFQEIDSVVLPAIARKAIGAENSPEYESFTEIAEFLLWAIMIADRYEAIMRKAVEAAQLREFFQEKAAFYESELLKYTTIENLFFTDSLETYGRAVAKQVDQLRKTKGGKK